jgi:transposase-like protein
MGTSNYSDEFKRNAVQQIRARGYPVREVSRRLGVSSHSLYKWMKLFEEPAGGGPAGTCSSTSRCSTTRNANTRTTACCRPLTSKPGTKTERGRCLEN